MNYNKLSRIVKSIWSIIGAVVLLVTILVFFVLKNESYYSTTKSIFIIYLASDIAINILLWWLGKKTERSNSK